MASADYTLANMVADVRRRAMLPNSTLVLSDADITGFLNDEMWEYVVPMLMATTEEYLVVATEGAVPTSTTIDLMDEGLFPGLIGLKIRDIQIASMNAWVSLPRIEPEYEAQFLASGTVQGYLFRGSKIHLVPVNQTPNAKIRVLYYKRPEALVWSTGQADKPGIPLDLCPLLIQRAVYRCLDALGDDRAEAAMAAAERTRITCIQLISPRGEGSARVVINYNGPGWTYRRRPYYMR